MARNQINLQGDHFTHSIDVTFPDGRLYEHVGGINNVAVANIAFEELRHYQSKLMVLELRSGATVMRRSRGFDRDRERFMEMPSNAERNSVWKDDDEGLWPEGK